ncbi:MAG: 50S ribosomal protein L6 [Gammaproteobacteria bacterium]|nr:50S ribosomal protein L6 [Gammaproteobacteria bacterium]
MARVLNPVEIPSGVTLDVSGQTITAKGAKGSLVQDIHPSVQIHQEDGQIRFSPANDDKASLAMTGTMRALTASVMKGVSEGYEKKLELVGVGYRASMQGSALNLTLGFSHPVLFEAPEGISLECATQTEVLVKGTDKQQVGQVAANIRAYRPPEPYKGKGVRYAGERIIRKEAKKK